VWSESRSPGGLSRAAPWSGPAPSAPSPGGSAQSLAGSAVMDKAGNTTRMLTHTITYALSNVLLPGR
jgi:hypothetical protein